MKCYEGDNPLQTTYHIRFFELNYTSRQFQQKNMTFPRGATLQHKAYLAAGYVENWNLKFVIFDNFSSF